jgi:hypothetical protein
MEFCIAHAIATIPSQKLSKALIPLKTTKRTYSTESAKGNTQQVYSITDGTRELQQYQKISYNVPTRCARKNTIYITAYGKGSTNSAAGTVRFILGCTSSSSDRLTT